MNSFELKKAILRLEEDYPLLTEQFITRSDSRRGIILSHTELVDIFYSEPKQETLFPFFDSVTVTKLREHLAQKDVKFGEYSSIVNRRMNLAELVLTHHKESVSKSDYEDTIEFFEVRRGGYLRQIAKSKESEAANWTEYAYWLLARVEKFKIIDPAKSEQLKQEARHMFDKAHDAGYTEATEALATFLYCETAQTDKAIKLWEKAAAAGNEMALKNLFEALCADDSLKVREIKVSLAKADGQALKNLFNTLKSNTDLTPYDAECAVLVSEAIALKEEVEREASQQIPTGISYPAWGHVENFPVPA
ncbi:MAG: hypothetical protein A3J37_01865 [Alphaproteobacteria bacterium RIFCSPHIGHO2_12_FULL_45_9]|nr:MAG: hypothetical protein A3B66_03485 [Alphaproteobacteria bacterium RIFCSPHIGHO2_02_FULL_46_13]OFW96032.1 MAG: hypothetical protein A3J37_01865 [Alphaproteobacteria bacterium RIFCSPHIGHO2_12_FULL_45_9]